MAFDAFLKYDGIKGESLDSKHKDEIQLLSYSFGASNQSSMGFGGGGGAGKVSLQSFNFTKKVDAGSPLMFQACCEGKHAKTATVAVRKAGGKQEEYLIYKFTDVMIDSYQVGGSPSGGDDVPMEQVSFSFGVINIEYKSQDATGKLGSPVIGGWDLQKNVKA